VTVTLNVSPPGVYTVPSTVTIPAGNYFAYIPVTGVAQGNATLFANAPGTRAADPINVTIGQPRLGVSVASTGGAGVPRSLTVFAQDANGNNRKVTSPLTVDLSSSGPASATFATDPITIPAGTLSAGTTVTLPVAGSYTITATAPGYQNGTANAGATAAAVSLAR
jgi:hypothetical protein